MENLIDLGSFKSIVDEMLRPHTAHHATVTAYLRTSLVKVPAVYVFKLGNVGDVRNVFDVPLCVPDNHAILKYGRTVDLKRRMSEHLRLYGKLSPGVDMGLCYHVMMHPTRLVDAEDFIGKSFKERGWWLNNPRYVELGVVSQKELKDDVRCLFKELVGLYVDVDVDADARL